MAARIIAATGFACVLAGIAMAVQKMLANATAAGVRGTGEFEVGALPLKAVFPGLIVVALGVLLLVVVAFIGRRPPKPN